MLLNIVIRAHNDNIDPTGVPFQAFRWKAGAQGRYKETIISILVAKERNICQGCLKDMRYDLPAGVRDSLLRDATASSNGQVNLATEQLN